MNLDDLADLLKRRGCDTIRYFHTDHFEPWSSNIDDDSARAVERMAAMARGSPYARKLSLFYCAFVPYRLEEGETVEAGGARLPGDGIVFFARTERQEELARRVIRPLVTADAHEMHLHVHHEFWTRNTSDFDNPMSRWVNAHSTPEADRERLDLHFRLCKEAIAREIGAPLERWGFIHGNWALNASDPQICHVNDEMAIIMRHGGFGDFSFPAGRAYCDPKIETPFTCLPIELPRAYDDKRADPRPVGVGTRALRQDRFFIWNSPIKSKYSSIDYYSPANRELFGNPERMVRQWLANSVVLDGRLFLKTHAHSMKWEYEIGKPGSVIPHCYPQIVSLFDCLARVCERARVELRLVTVNEVMAELRDLDGGGEGTEPPGAGRGSDPETPAAGPRGAAEPPAAAAAAAAETAAGGFGPPFLADGGAAWRIVLPSELQPLTDTDAAPSSSPLRLFEDGAPLGPAHALHQAIREAGRGAYSFWKKELWFSTSDGSDPNANGRVYSVTQAAQPIPASPPDAAEAEAVDPVLPLHGRTGLLYSVFGDKRLPDCPVCRSRDTIPLWRLPLAEHEGSDVVATLRTPAAVCCFDFCRGCESIFLNPVAGDRKAARRRAGREAPDAAAWPEYEAAYDAFAGWIPAGAAVMIDAACGAGQYLHIARRRGSHRWQRLIGLDVAANEVRQIGAEALEAHVFDLDGDDLARLVEPESADFIVLRDAFAQAERPLDALARLLAALRPGGRLYLTARRYGAEVRTAVRPQQAIYIGEKIAAEMPQRLGCRILDLRTDEMRYHIVLEK